MDKQTETGRAEKKKSAFFSLFFFFSLAKREIKLSEKEGEGHALNVPPPPVLSRKDFLLLLLIILVKKDSK